METTKLKSTKSWKYGKERYGVSQYLVRMRENADQNNSEYVHFLRSVSMRQILEKA